MKASVHKHPSGLDTRDMTFKKTALTLTSYPFNGLFRSYSTLRYPGY